MSLLVGFATEGPTDRAVLKVLVEHVFGTFRTSALQPELDESTDTKTAGGESRLKAWCEQQRDQIGLETLLGLGTLDLIVLQIDADVCTKYGCADTTALCRHVRDAWLGLSAPYPDDLVVVIPAQATEAWLLAALDPELHATVEAMPRPADELGRRGLLPVVPDRKGRDVTRKPSPVYEGLAAAHLTSDRLSELRKHLVELERFLGKLEAVRSRKLGPTPDAN